MSDLEAATVDQLIDELEKRYPVGLLVAGVRDSAGDENSEDFYIRQCGSVTTVIGIAARSLGILQRGARRNSEEVDEP